MVPLAVGDGDVGGELQEHGLDLGDGENNIFNASYAGTRRETAIGPRASTVISSLDWDCSGLPNEMENAKNRH